MRAGWHGKHETDASQSCLPLSSTNSRTGLEINHWCRQTAVWIWRLGPRRMGTGRSPLIPVQRVDIRTEPAPRRGCPPSGIRQGEAQGRSVRILLPPIPAARCIQALPLPESLKTHPDGPIRDRTDSASDTLTGPGARPKVPLWSRNPYPGILTRFCPNNAIGEMAFLRFIQWRAVTTRYTQQSAYCLAVIQPGDNDSVWAVSPMS